MAIPHAGVVKPGTSRNTKTGSWRVQRPVFLHQECIGCRQCEYICPEGCVFGEGKHFEADLDYCKGCGLCAAVCPKQDIVMKPEENKA